MNIRLPDIVTTITRTSLLFLLCIGAGCDKQGGFTLYSRIKIDKLLTYAPYEAVQLEIMPLTEFVNDESDGESGIKIYVSLLDSTGCQRKTPGVFRFELYNKVKLTAKPKGRRVAIWPDIDLIKIENNNIYWRDFLRAYEFDLYFEPEDGEHYILQVTCMCPNGKRLWAEYELGEKAKNM